jgi:F-type H+-transporting ATPase subunit epsilon
MFTLTLVTPQKKLLTEVEVEEVIVPAFRGQLDILPGHVPLVSTLSAGILKVKLKGESKYKSAAIGWGYMEVNPKGVVVLADNAEWPAEIDKLRAEEQLKIAEKRLQEAGLSIDDHAKAVKKIDKERARIEAVKQ